MKKSIFVLSLFSIPLLLAGCKINKNKSSNTSGGNGSNSGSNDSSGSSTSINYAVVTFYIDYNNIDPEHPYAVVNATWGSAITAPSTPTAPDPAFPTFLGWSERTVVDDPKYLYDLSKPVANKTYTITLYGIWVSAD